MRKMMLVVLGLVASQLSAVCQDLPENFHFGSITNKEGKVEEGIIHQVGGPEMPFGDHHLVEFITTDKWNDGNYKKKDLKKFKPKELQGYAFEGRNYITAKYADLTAAGPAMLPTWYFFEPMVEGKITLYRFYQMPVLEGSDEQQYAEIRRVTENPDILIVKGDEKIKNVVNIELADYLVDNEEVLEKYYSGQYGFTPSKTKDQKGLKGLMNQVSDSESVLPHIEEIVRDYNQ